MINNLENQVKPFGLEDIELYKEIVEKTAEKYGFDSPAYKRAILGVGIKSESDIHFYWHPKEKTFYWTPLLSEVKYDEVEHGKLTGIDGGSFFWNLELNEHLPKNKRIFNIYDFENAYDNLDIKIDMLSSEIIFYGQGKEKIPQISKDLKKQLEREKIKFSYDNPAIISNLQAINSGENFDYSDKSHGLRLSIGPNTKITRDSRFAITNLEENYWGDEYQIYEGEFGNSDIQITLGPQNISLIHFWKNSGAILGDEVVDNLWNKKIISANCEINDSSICGKTLVIEQI